MPPTDDSTLLRQYLEHRSDEAFAALVARHINLVYSVALRHVGDPHLAEEVAQAIFIIFAKKAGQLRHDKALSSWLFQTTRLTAGNFVRGETRRHRREQEAYMRSVLNESGGDVWPDIAPLLDDAVAELDESDREAILLRFYEGRNFREVGAILGASENAAQKRVTRAVERLREYFAKHGVTTGAAGLAVVLSANAVQAAPVGLTVTISTAAVLAGTTITTAATSTAVKTIAMTTIQKVLVSLAVVAFLGAAAYKATRASLQKSEPDQVSALVPSTDLFAASRAMRFGALELSNAHKQSVTPDLAKLKDSLRRALHNVPRSQYGTRSYPPEEVFLAISNFGSNRKAAFATLREAANDPDPEVRKRAISAMMLLGEAPIPPQLAGEPAPEAKSFLLEILSHGTNEDEAFVALSGLRSIGFEADEIPLLAEMQSTTTNLNLKRYLPEAIAKTIQDAPDAAARYVSIVEGMLNNTNAEVQFAAACALAKSEVARDPQILQKLTVGLNSGGLQSLMALETLQGLGPSAQPALTNIIAFANSATDDVMRDLAFRTIGKINGELRNTVPQVDQTLKTEETTEYWNEKFSSGSYTQPDLLEALKRPMFATMAARHLGELGARAQDAIPNLIAALTDQDESARDIIVQAMRQIDPQINIVKVDSQAIAAASQAATWALDNRPAAEQDPSLTKLLIKNQRVNSAWRTQQELVELCNNLAARNQAVYLAFTEKLFATDPALKNLLQK